jgi:hypothetical protein
MTQSEPGSQSRHPVLLMFDTYFPPGQRSHDGDLAFALKVPGRQGSGSTLPLMHDVPAGQLMHSSSDDMKDTFEDTFACVPPGQS